MELIIKPTGRCNFNCTFCSAACMNIIHTPDKVHDKIKDLIEKLKPQSIIVTGGDPLMVNPKYYYNLHDIAKCNISATSNLKDFYFHPDKWAPLFNEKWFRISTSFQYGDGRMWDKNTVFTEEMFLKVVDKYRECTGRPAPPFIAVIDETNEHLAMDHVLLAKRLGTTVKLNNMLPVGLQDKMYPRYKIFKIYLDVIDKGLSQYEANCAERFISKCPRNLNFSCNKNIRCCYVDNDDNLHVGICDDYLAMGHELQSEEIVREEDFQLPFSEFITPECAYCELFRICNGCNINREQAKKDPNYCEEMKKLEKRIIRTGWLI